MSIGIVPLTFSFINMPLSLTTKYIFYIIIVYKIKDFNTKEMRVTNMYLTRKVEIHPEHLLYDWCQKTTALANN